jgi:hypothetical protein
MRVAPSAHDRLPPVTAQAGMSGAWSACIEPAVVIAGCLTFALVLFLPSILNDGDTLWQIRTGEWMLDHRAIPATDPFSFTAGERQWFPHEWLAEVLMALAFRAAGLPGVMVLTAGAVGLTAAVLMHRLRRFLPDIYACVGVVLALCNAAPSLLARPHVLAWPCLALWCGGLVAARARRTAPSLALLPVMALWVNLHGSFLLGLLLPGTFMIEALFDEAAKPRQVLAAWGTFMLAAFAVALLNPAGLGGVMFPVHLLGMTSLSGIGEWGPAVFDRFQPLELTILGGLALGFSGKATLPPIRLAMLLGLVHASLSHGRHQQLLGIVGALILAEPLGRCLPSRGTAAASVAWRMTAMASAVFALGALVVRAAVPLSPDRTGGAFAAVLDQVPPALRARPVLNDYSLGGALIFSGVRPFIDSRADLYGDAFVGRYRRIIAPNRAELDRVLADYGIVWAIFRAGEPIVQLLDQEPGWQRLAETDGIAIFASRDAPAQ